MSLEKAVEAAIREAQERGEFSNLKGAGKPLDLSAYFEAPEDLRLAYAVLKNANMVSAEVELLNEIAVLKEKLAATQHPSEQARLYKVIREKQMQFNLLMEHRKPKSRKK